MVLDPPTLESQPRLSRRSRQAPFSLMLSCYDAVTDTDTLAVLATELGLSAGKARGRESKN